MVPNTMYHKNYTRILETIGDTVPQTFYIDLLEVFRGHCITKLYMDFIGAVSRTLCNKNYTWTSLELFRGHCITKSVHGFYWSCSEDTVSQNVYMDFIGAVSVTLYHKKCTWTSVELSRGHCITKSVHTLYGVATRTTEHKNMCSISVPHVKSSTQKKAIVSK
jgi:hypothetical protein